MNASQSRKRKKGRPGIPAPIRDAIRYRDGYCCVFCGSQSKLTYHHIKPQALGGSNAPENLVTLCNTCHSLMELGIRRSVVAIQHDVYLAMDRLYRRIDYLSRFVVSYSVWLVYGPRFLLTILFKFLFAPWSFFLFLMASVVVWRAGKY